LIEAVNEAEAAARHPRLTRLRRLPVGRVGIVLIAVSTTIAIAVAKSGRLGTEAPYFLPPLCIVGFLALIDAWDLAVGFAAWRNAPYLVLPERIQLPAWTAPVAQWLAPIMLLVGIVAAHYYWL
jgi:NADH:ubiquinone oxidoreductase subunit 2 (subunit N)